MKKKLSLRKETVAVLGGRQLESVYGGQGYSFNSNCLCISENVACKPGDSDGCVPAPESDGCRSFPCPNTIQAYCNHPVSVKVICTTGNPESCPCEAIYITDEC